MSDYEPDWSKAPEWARYWARDANGGALWYEEYPNSNVRQHCWDVESGKYAVDDNACPNWRETLRERPEAKKKESTSYRGLFTYMRHLTDEKNLEPAQVAIAIDAYVSGFLAGEGGDNDDQS